ncbi:MAG: sialic acid O-acetyltransferase [Thomasclavelia sp.]
MYKKLLIVGAGGHGKCCHEIALGMKLFSWIDFLDDQSNDKVNVIGTIDEMSSYYPEYENIFIAIGNNTLRCRLMDQAEQIGYNLVSLISPYSYVSKSAQIEKGSVVFPHAVIQSNVLLKQGVIVSSNALVDHDVVVGKCCHINAGAIIPSMSHVKEFTKLDYRKVYEVLKEDTDWEEKHKQDFGTELSFF